MTLEKMTALSNYHNENESFLTQRQIHNDGIVYDPREMFSRFAEMSQGVWPHSDIRFTIVGDNGVSLNVSRNAFYLSTDDDRIPNVTAVDFMNRYFEVKDASGYLEIISVIKDVEIDVDVAPENFVRFVKSFLSGESDVVGLSSVYKPSYAYRRIDLFADDETLVHVWFLIDLMTHECRVCAVVPGVSPSLYVISLDSKDTVQESVVSYDLCLINRGWQMAAWNDDRMARFLLFEVEPTDPERVCIADEGVMHGFRTAIKMFAEKSVE